MHIKKKNIPDLYMDHIFEANDSFLFDKLTVGKPVSVSGGNFFIRYSMNGSPLYIQPSKCSIKHTLTKTGKKCDLIFGQESEFIQWMENLEARSQTLIHENKDKWFETPLEMEDIESSFASPMKIYKSGKFYTVRTNVPNKNGKITLKIYDEDEKDVAIDTIKENTNVMVILEIQGIRCSSSSFQIDIEIKQMMVLKPEELFSKFIFKKKSSTSDDLGKLSEIKAQPDIENPEENKDDAEESDEDDEHEDNANQTVFIETPASSSELCEIDFNLDEMPNSDTVVIKERKEMYYQMYRDARQKAKVARDLALSAYLEAKQIKNTYMLDDILSSDESSDEDDDDEKEE